MRVVFISMARVVSKEKKCGIVDSHQLKLIWMRKYSDFINWTARTVTMTNVRCDAHNMSILIAIGDLHEQIFRLNCVLSMSNSDSESLRVALERAWRSSIYLLVNSNLIQCSCAMHSLQLTEINEMSCIQKRFPTEISFVVSFFLFHIN